MRLIDSHCHLDLSPFDIDRAAVLDRAASHHISDVIVPAVQSSTWQALWEITQQSHEVNVHAAYGLHPVFEQHHATEDLQRLDNCLASKAAIAVGECGLDFFIDQYDQAKQMNYFVGQLDLAVQYDLPVIIHSRKSLDLVLKELRLRPTLTGVIHSYSGSLQQAKQLIDLGFYLGFGGPITYTRATKLRRLVTELPLESLLLETDAPDQPDSEHHGQRNEPSWLGNIAQCIANLRSIDLEVVAEMTTNNSRQLFSV